MIALGPAILTILCVALVFRSRHRTGFHSSELGMIAEPCAIGAVGHVEVAPGSVHCQRFRWTQFGVITIADPVLAVSEVALLRRDCRFPSFGLGQVCNVARSYAVFAI